MKFPWNCLERSHIKLILQLSVNSVNISSCFSNSFPWNIPRYPHFISYDRFWSQPSMKTAQLLGQVPGSIVMSLLFGRDLWWFHSGLHMDWLWICVVDYGWIMGWLWVDDGYTMGLWQFVMWVYCAVWCFIKSFWTRKNYQDVRTSYKCISH